MKNVFTMKYTILIICVACMLTSWPQVKAQDGPYKARISVEYHKIMSSESFIEANVKFKGENGYQPAAGLALNVYQVLAEDSMILINEIITNETGRARLQIAASQFASNDSSLIHEYVVKIENSDKFRDAKKAVSFADANLLAEVIEIDSVIHISANLTDGAGKPIAEERLKVRIQRLFAPLTIGKPYYETDDEGNILVPFADPLPGIDGILNFEIIFESDDYGVVHNIFKAPVGKIIVDESTFDQRTIWSPPSKTPIFLWVFANVLILGAWLVIFLLVANLYKIYKA